MASFYLQVEIAGRKTTLMVEQLNQLTDSAGFMRYQIKTFHQHSVVFVYIENEPLPQTGMIGFSEDDGFSAEELKVISLAIREDNSTRRRSADQIAIDF